MSRRHVRTLYVCPDPFPDLPCRWWEIPDPASCAEHHLSHLWEMEVINGHLDALHGEKVSVGMMLVLKEYKRIAQAIRQGLCQVKTYEPQEALLEETFGKKGLLDGIKKENDPEPLLEIDPARLFESLSDIAEP